MFKKLQACYETYMKTFFSSVKEEPYNPTGSVFHKQRIVSYGTNVRNTQLPLEQRAQAAKNIGLLAYTGNKANWLVEIFLPLSCLLFHHNLNLRFHICAKIRMSSGVTHMQKYYLRTVNNAMCILFADEHIYTCAIWKTNILDQHASAHDLLEIKRTSSIAGGPNAGIYASDYIQDLIDILHMPDTSANVRILVLQGLCGICYINYSNQNKVKDLNLANVLFVCLTEDENSSPASNHITVVKFWVCYLLTVLCCNNIPYIRKLHELGGQMLETKLKSLSRMEWSGWPDNYAEVLFSLLGFHKGQLTSAI
ncbi:armadillo-like helical domain-containing protein 2 [Pangshura tecta]